MILDSPEFLDTILNGILSFFRQYLIALEEGPNGTVDNVYRKYKVRAEALPRQYPDIQLNDQLQRLIENKPQEMVELIEAVILDPERKDYCYHIIHEKTKDELVFRRMDTTPWIVARYMKIPGEVFGRGPLVTAIPSIALILILAESIALIVRSFNSLSCSLEATSGTTPPKLE